MPTITVFNFNHLPNINEICKNLNGKRFGDCWVTARVSKYNENEVYIQYWYYEPVEENLRKIFSEEDAHEIVSFLKENGKSKVLKRTYCFINLVTKTLEIYRWPDEKTEKILSIFEGLLKTKFKQLSIKSEYLKKIYSEHGSELKQAMFKNIDGLIYYILRGNCLENNEKFKKYLETSLNSLRVISFRPRIRFLNDHDRYQVTINGDKGTIRLSGNEIFQWRPRFEIRQLIFIIAAVTGLLPLKHSV
jgi:hypothetical protein